MSAQCNGTHVSLQHGQRYTDLSVSVTVRHLYSFHQYMSRYTGETSEGQRPHDNDWGPTQCIFMYA